MGLTRVLLLLGPGLNGILIFEILQRKIVMYAILSTHQSLQINAIIIPGSLSLSEISSSSVASS